MKKFAFIAFIALIFLACTPEEHYDVIEPYSYTKTYTITEDMWLEGSDDSGIYYYYQIKNNNLSQTVFDRGIMQAFLYYNIDNSDTMCPLPFSDFVVDREGYKWEEQFTVEFQPGYITFILKIDDHAAIYPFYPSYDFLVRFLW